MVFRAFNNAYDCYECRLVFSSCASHRDCTPATFQIILSIALHLRVRYPAYIEIVQRVSMVKSNFIFYDK